VSPSTGLVVDSSAVLALLRDEPGAEDLLTHLERAVLRLLSAATLVEVGIVAEARFGPAGGQLLDRFVREGDIEVVSLDREQADRALEGWRRFGKGRHPAALNLGDCFAYGLAIARGLPILCVGDDFAATDIGVLRPAAS
jgi:ribonuclease VapC